MVCTRQQCRQSRCVPSRSGHKRSRLDVSCMVSFLLLNVLRPVQCPSLDSPASSAGPTQTTGQGCQANRAGGGQHAGAR